MLKSINQKLFLLPLGIYCLILPFEELLTFGKTTSQSTLSRYVGFFVIYLFLSKILLTKSFSRPGRAQFWMIGFVAFGCISFFWSLVPVTTFERIPTVLSLLIFYLIVGSLRIDQDGLDFVLLFIIIGGVAAALYTIYAFHFLGLDFMDSARATIVFEETTIDPNQFAFTLLLPFSLLLLKLSLYTIRKGYLFLLPALLIIGYSILITGSRSGFLALTTIILIYFFLKVSLKIKFLIVTLVLMAIFSIEKSDILSYRLIHDERSFEYTRGGIWLIGLSDLPGHWVVGQGLDSFPTIFMNVAKYKPTGPHSIYIGMLLEVGVVGLLIMMIAFFYQFKTLPVRQGNNPDIAFALKATLMGMLVQGAFLDTFYLKTFWLVLTLIMMLSGQTLNLKKQQKRNPALSA